MKWWPRVFVWTKNKKNLIYRRNRESLKFLKSIIAVTGPPEVASLNWVSCQGSINLVLLVGSGLAGWFPVGCHLDRSKYKHGSARAAWQICLGWRLFNNYINADWFAVTVILACSDGSVQLLAHFFLVCFMMRALWMWGMTPPPAMVALIKVSSSSSPLMASNKCLGVILLTLRSLEALPASSRTSAVKYSRMAAV